MKHLSHLEQRALAAYYRKGADVGSINQPGSVETVEHKGLIYIRLTNVNGTLAVYRVRTMADGSAMLKGLKRWPAAVEA